MFQGTNLLGESLGSWLQWSITVIALIVTIRHYSHAPRFHDKVKMFSQIISVSGKHTKLYTLSVINTSNAKCSVQFWGVRLARPFERGLRFFRVPSQRFNTLRLGSEPDWSYVEIGPGESTRPIFLNKLNVKES